MPGRATSLRPLNIAHRGASAYAPENTFAAFDLAIAMGADAIELDVHMTRDGELVAFHDEFPSRTVRGLDPGAAMCIRDVVWSSLAGLDAGAWFNDSMPAFARTEYARQRIPRVSEVFARYGSSVSYFLELKHPPRPVDMEGKLLALIDEHRLFGHRLGRPRVYVESFNQRSLQKIRALEERVAVIQLFGAYATSGAIRAYVDAVPAYATAIGPCARSLDAALAAHARRLDLDVFPWTVNAPSEMRMMLGLDVGGVVTDVPDVLGSVMAAPLADAGGAPVPADH